jgi:hypothetical protein
MNTQRNQTWHTDNLIQLGNALGEGYGPGMGQDDKAAKSWSTQKHLQAANMLSHGYNPGV